MAAEEIKIFGVGCGTWAIAFVLGSWTVGLSWCSHSCSQATERAEAERNAQALARAEEAKQQAEREREWAKEAETKRLAVEAAAAARLAFDTHKLRAAGPAGRAAAARRCSSDLLTCPGGAGDPSGIYEAAASPTERRRLEASFAAAKAQADKQRAAAERSAARANAPLLCCDGSGSPTCTCGHPRRGCCSHHGGVCGCTAD